MRIAVLCGGSYVGGTEIVALTVASGLRERGHDVRVLANAWTDGDFVARLAAAQIPHASIHLGKISLTLRRPYLQWTLAALARLPGALVAARRWFREFGPDVVIANNRDTILLLAPLLRGRPVLFHMHEAPAPTRATRMLYRRIATHSSMFVAVSAYVRSRLVELGVDGSRTQVVYNGVAPTAMTSRGAARGAPFTIGIVGRIAPWKGHEDLMAALAILDRRNVPWRCVVAGSGAPDYVRQLEASAEALGISGRISWRGFVDPAERVYSELDACVVPSRVEESFGMVAVEAGLAGLPVIATRRGGLPEIVRDGETGLLVETEQPLELADQLARLASDASLRQRLGGAARERMLAEFTAERMIGGIEAACERAVAARATAGEAILRASAGARV